MRRALACCLFTFILAGAACTKTEDPPGVDSANAATGGRAAASGGKTGSGGAGGGQGDGTGGSGSGGTPASTGGSGGTPASTGGSGGAGGGQGGGAGGGQGGGAGGAAANATGGSAGNGSGGSDAAVDRPVTADSSAPTVDADKPADVAGDAKPGKYWIKTCPADNKADCCAFWCACMKTNCPADEPMNCMNTCMGFTNLPCRTYQCFESLNPNVPQDKRSHCGHAIGRGGFGGNCPNK